MIKLTPKFTFKFTPLASAILMATAISAQAAPTSYTPIATGISYGDASNPNTIYSTTASPANNAMTVTDTDGYRIGVGANIQIQAEFDGLEGSKDFLDDRIRPILNTEIYTPQSALNLQNETNAFLTKYNDGNFSTLTGVTVPVMVKHEFLGGGISFDYTRQYGARGHIVKQGDVTAYDNNGELGISSGDAALGVDYKQLDEFALSFGMDVMNTQNGALSVGLTARYLNLLSNTKLVDVSEIANDNLGNRDKDVNDYIKGIESGSSHSNFTADIGVNWTAENYMVGVVGMNLTNPKFDVNNQSSAQTTADFSGEIDSKYELKPQYRLMAQWFSKNRHWTLAGSYDLVKANDLNNEDTQWWSASIAYATNTAWYIPDVRAGLRGNQVGTGYTYGTAGLTFGFLTLDVASTTTDFSGVTDKQKDAGVMGSIGLVFDF
ncbi:MAG: conjugal transfer protein TraF [Hydrogenovibrio sp.]